jgi:hypothetical protein
LGLCQCSSVINGLESRPTQIFMQLLSVLAFTTETLRSGHMFLFSSFPAVVHLLRVASQCHVLELFICETRNYKSWHIYSPSLHPYPAQSRLVG